MEPHRLRAPSTDGALLAEPALAASAELVDSNRQRLDAWNYDFQGRSASWLRARARGEILEHAGRFLTTVGLSLPASLKAGGPLIVTGHQPELFHPGVWIKNFATAALATRVGGLGLNLIVDNDIPKSSSIKIPTERDGELRVERVAFDDWRGEAPYEDLTVHDEAAFASFGERARGSHTRDFGPPAR